MQDLGRVNLVPTKVPAWMKHNLKLARTKNFTTGRLDFPDRPCQRCEGEKVVDDADCKWCEGLGYEWISFLKSKDEIGAQPSAEIIVLPAGVQRDGRWHISVAHRMRLPSWEELSIAHVRLCPQDTDFIMAFPRREIWMNMHEFVLHLWEVRDPNLQSNFEANAYSGPTLQENQGVAYDFMRGKGFHIP